MTIWPLLVGATGLLTLWVAGRWRATRGPRRPLVPAAAGAGLCMVAIAGAASVGGARGAVISVGLLLVTGWTLAVSGTATAEPPGVR